MLELYIFLALGAIFIIIGIITFLMKKPASLWSNFKGIEPKDYKPYNLRVGLLWIGFGIYVALLGVIAYFIEGNIRLIPLILGMMLGVILLMVIYSKIELKYKNK